MNHTQNYNLNQWEASDRVQRTDFNADNAKIDAAIKAVDSKADALSAGKADKTALETAAAANPYVKLLDMTTATDTAQINLSVSQFNLAQFQRLELHFSGTANPGGSVAVRLNGRTTDYYYASYGSAYNDRGELITFVINANPGGAHITLHLFGEQLFAAYEYAVWDGYTIQYRGTTVGAIRAALLPVSAMHTINLVCNNNTIIKAGARATLWGVKL